MNKQVLHFLVPLAAFAATTTPATAANISLANSYSGLQPSASSNITISQFNPSLGTLNSINVTLSANSSFNVNATNIAYPSNAQSAQAIASENINLQLNSFTLSASPTATSSTITVPADSNATLPTFTATASNSQNVPTASFSDFTGTGVISFLLSADQLNLSQGSNSSADVFYLNDSVTSTSTSGAVNVQYNYTPVPEPSEVGGSFLALGMGWLIKRKLVPSQKIR